MAHKKLQATAKLFLDTSDAQNDATKFVKDIKQKLLNIETAADKMTVFKDMVEYIAQIDQALSALKSKNANAFNKAFGGLDVNLKQVTEMLMGITSVDIGNLDAIRTKIDEIVNSGKKTGHNDTFKQIAKDLNNLYRAMGYEGDKLSLDDFGGGGKFEQKLKLLTDAVEDFGLSFGGVSDRIANAFGLEGATNVGKFGQKVREELAKINAESKEIELLRDRLNSISNMKVKVNGLLEVSSNLDASVMSAEELISTMAELYNKLQNREAYSSDLDYYKDYVKYVEVAKKIKALEAKPAGMDLLTKQTGDVYDISLEAIEFAEEFAKEGKSQILEALDVVEATAKSRAREVRLSVMKELGFGSGTGSGDGGSSSEKQAVSYQKLIAEMQEINRLQDDLDNFTFGTDEYNKAEECLESAKQKFVDLYVVADKVDDALDVLNEISIDGMIDFDQFTKLCDMISVDMTNGMSQFKETTVEAKSTVENLGESIKKIYSSALQLEVDTRNGNASGKESMNLFGADGIVSTTQGTDYQVDTDTLVQQLVANLNRDIVMSLHNHANGDMTFSPSDINTFAKMYYGQGTKINGIIANGFIHTIDFNSIGQEVAIQIAQDYQEGIQHFFKAKNISQFASFENGSIVPTDLLKQIQESNPENYQEIVDQLQDAQMTVLRQAFEKNGAEFTLRSFGLDNIDELTTYLTSVQKNTQNAIEPVEKLKNLISILRPSADLSEFTEVFDKFKSGAIDGSQALSKVLDLTSIDETNQKLREQEQLLENVKVAIKNGIGEAVGLDNMVMTLEVIEQEIKDGVLTSLEDCITRFKEFNNISEDGSLEFVGKREHVIPDYYGTYLLGEDEVISSEEINKLRQLSNQQEQLYQNLRSAIKGTLSDVVDVDDMTYAFDTLEKEIEAGLLTTLDQCIERFKLLIGLDDKRLTSIKDDQRVADSWDYYQGNRYVDDGETVINSSEYNQLREDLADEQDRANQYAGDAAVAEDRADKAEARAAEAEARVLEVESDALRYQESAYRLLEEKSALQRENDELREQLTIQTDADHKSQLAQAEIAQLELLQQKLLEIKTAVDAKTQAFEEEYVTVDGVVDAEITSLQSLIAQLQEVVAQINLINDGFNNINTNAPKVELKSAPVEQSVTTTENPYYLTDSRGNRKLMYRGVHGAISGLVSNRYHGGTFFTDLISLAKQYAGMNGKVESANISMKNPLEIDARGHQWNDLLYIGNGADEASKKIYRLRADIEDLEMQLNNVFDEYGAIDDIDLHAKLTDDLDAKRNELKSIYDDPSNPYKKYDTNSLVEYAKSAGYDGVIFRNIKDGTNEISNIAVTLQENQIHFVETLKTNFESLLTDFIGYFGKIEDFLSHYNKFKTDDSLFPEIEDDGRDIFREQLEKYEELSIFGEPEITNEFLNKNKILGAYDKRVPGGLNDLLALDDVDERIDAIVSFYLNAIYELEKIQEAFNTKATSVEQYQREQSGNLTSYDKISTVKSGYSDRALNDRESYKYADATIEDLDVKKDQAITAVNAFNELFANLDIETANPEQLKKVVDSFVSAIKLIDDAQSMATGIVENSIGAPDTNAMRDFHELGPIRDSLTADYLDILQAEAKQIEQIEIDALNAQEQRLKSEQESVDIISKKTQVDAVPDANVQEEISQLNQLKATLDEVKNAILAKTKAFVDEGDVVGQVVGKEVSALMKLEETVDSIIPKVNALVSGLKGLSEHGADIKITGSDDAGKTSSGRSDAPPVDPFKAKLSAQKGVFAKYRNDVQDADYLTEDLKKQIDSLGISLQEVTDPAGLDNWLKRFANLKADIQAVRSEFEQMNLGSINLFQRELTNSFNKLTLPQKEDMLKEYLQAIVLLNRQKQAVEEGHAVEVAAIKEITAELQKKINAQIEANKVAKDAEKVQKKNGNFGSTASINATAKYNSLIEKASNKQFANSSTIAAALMDYEEAYRRMIKTRDELRSKDFVDDSDKEEFKRLTTECNKASSALEKLIKNTMKLKGEAVNENPYLLGSDFKDDKDGRVSELTNFVQGIKGADLATLQFKDNWNEVVFAVDNGDGTFTQMTATFTDARNEIIALAGDTKKVQGKFESFIDGVKNRLQSLSQYFIATVGIYDVWNVIKQGINHVREIDTALTELKKVTNETDASYNKFLQDMSKTGSVIGATVKDLTTMAADWSRLGYSMEEAGKLAESTAVLLNVSEFKDATEASEALISTMQAFQYTADESGHVVDILNEVGNNFAVSSDGLAIALQDSASALMEGGNNLEQAVALVASANKVVQDPNSVGSALRTISLRLRGTSVEVLEEMGEETDGVAESTSKLQEKLKALTGVDIVDMNGAYKDTYTILKEIGSVWKDLDPMDQAAALELMAGKNRANTLAAILNNMKDLEGAYNDAIKAEGSALKENQAYLDSIQGRIDLFNNSVQTMWMNLLDTDVIKGVVNLGIEFIQFLDSSAGRVTALGAALSILGKVLKIAPVVSSANGQLQILGKTVETIKNNFAQLSEQSTGAFGKIKSAFTSVFTDPSAGKIDLSGMLSEDSFNEKLNGLISGFNNIDQSINAISWDDYVNGVSKSDQAMGAALKTCTSHNGTIIAGTSAYQTYTGAATTAAVGTSAVGGAAQATTGKLIAMKVAALTANAALTMGLSLIISLAIKGVTAWANAGETARKAAQDAVNASEELKEQNESLKDYKDQIRELRTELDSNTLSESEAYDAREKLLTIQNELIDKFGLERDGINLVTGAIEDQIAAIDALSQKDAQQWLNNNQKSINEAIDFFDNPVKGGYLDSIGTSTTITNWGVTSNVSDMIREYANNPDNSHIEVGTTINGIGQDINFTGSAEEVKTQVEDFQDWLGTKETELQKELTGLTSMPASERTDDIKNKIESLKKDIEQLQDVREDIGTEYTNWFGENSTYSANKALLEETQYNTAITKYAEQYGDILDAQTKLAEAQAKGDKDGIKSAIETINFETAAAATIAEANGESYMASFFNGIQSEYAKLSNEIKFETDLFENILFGDSGKGVRDVLSEALSGLEGMNAKEILQLGEIDPNNTAFVSLNQIAQSYGMTIEELCNSLVKLKYIQSGFGAETESNVASLSAKTYSKLTEEVESYNNILSQTSEIVSDNTEITQEYKDSLKALGISEEELGECFDENNGLIVKNASALRKLVAQKKKDKQVTVQQAKSMSQLQYKNTVQQLQQVVKAMAVEVRASGLVSSAALKTSASLREQIEALKQTIQQYALLEISLSDAANAYSEFEAAKERDAQLTYGDSMIEMLQTINEGFKTGQVGTEAFQYAVKVIVPESEYAHIDNIEQRMIAIHDYIDKNPLFADWFTIDEGEFSIALDNINSFIDDAFSAGLFTNDSSGDFFLTEAIKNAQDPLKEFADQLGKAFNTEVTEGSVLAMLSELEKYDASWGNILTDLTTTPIDRAINDATTALEEALTAQEEFIRSGGDLNSDKYIELEEAVSAARGALDKASQAAIDNAQTYTQVEAVLKGMTGEVKYTQEQADALARSLGLINENGHIQIDTETGALILTQEQLDALNERLIDLTEPTILDVQLAYDEIDRQLQELNAYLSDPSNYGGTILTELNITNEGEAKAKVDELTADRDAIQLVYNITTTSTEEAGTFEKLTTWEANGVQIVISGDASAFDTTVSTVNAVEMEEKDVIITADPTEANANIDSVDNNNIDDKDPGIYMQGVSVALNDIYSIDDALDTLPSTKDVYVNVHYRENGAVRVNGTAHVDGTAYSNGNLGAHRTEVALTGELGPEMVVRDGRWFTVGENGAEFTQIKKGDIIFNHKQTEDLLSKGYVTSRGKAYASGTIPNTNSGTAYYKTFGGYAGDNDVFENGSANWMDPWTNSFSGAADDLSDAADSMSDAADDSEQVVDFIEMKLEEIEAIIEKTTGKIENFLDDTTDIRSKDELYDELVKAEKDKAETYLKAAQKYNVEAAAALSGVPQKYQEMARNGAIAIKEFLGEDQVEIAEAIEEYRDWASKADEAENGHLEAIAAISAHRVEQLEDIATDFENIVSISKSHSDLLQAEMDLIEESGNRLSESYYEELKKNSQKQLDDMQAERVALQKILDDSVAAGDVIIGSDDWYSMLETIYEVDQEIVDCKTSLEEFQNAINELYWDNFDKLIEEIDNVNSELSNLYDLISDDDKIVDEMGNWTDDGITALGLLAQQMENAQFKSEEYGKAIAQLKRDYADGLYSTDEYNEKLSELTDGQYDAIKSYEDAKDAIVDLNKTRVDAVKDGLQKEIDKYSELIEKKKESLSESKAAKEFEDQVQESNKNIKGIERQIAALKGNTSSSAMAQRKRLEAELLKAREELNDLYYDHSIEKQQEALDKELEDYTKNKEDQMNALDEYLKKEEQVIADSFDLIAENTKNIANTLIGISEEYGVSISDTVATPWINGTNAIGAYQEQLNTSVSATTANLETLKQHLENLQTQADKTAESIVAATHSTVIGTNDGHQTSIKGYAKGSNGVEYDQWAILDELGEELQLVPNKSGRLDYIKKGTAILNNTLTDRLINLAMDPTSMLENSRPVIGAPGIATINNNISIDMSIAEVVHIDHADSNSINDITKAVKTQMDNYMRDINNKLRRK